MPRTRRVAIMIDLQWPLKYHQEIFAGTQRYAQQRGNWECQFDLHAGDSLRTGRAGAAYDGVIARATSRLAARAKRARVPVVNVWLNSPVNNVPSVFYDVETAARMAAEHLMARGLRHFAYLGYFRDRVSRLEIAAFRATLSAAGFACSHHLTTIDVGKTPAVWKKFRAGLAQWIDAWPRPIGVFVSHDVLARYLADVCLRKNVRVPDDAALVSTYNELAICLHPKPALSSIDFGCEEVGYRAAELLDQLMDGAKPPKKPLLVEPAELVARQSTDVFAVGDPMVARAMRFIAEHGHGQLQVGAVARHVCAARRTLELRFRHTVGRTIAGEIARLRVERVKRQLLESDAPLKVLAARLGFRNEQRLCEAFRRVEGITPGEYRRRSRKLAGA